MTSYILSVSRRTDIPAFYTDWFINRLKEQHVFVRHPYSKELIHVSLKPEDILGIVFWSKDFSPLLSRINEVEKVTGNLFFHFTITGMSKEIEFNTPFYKEAIEDLIFIAKRYSPENVIWRFDPICITDKISFQEHMESFIRCAEMLREYINTCYISFANPYYKVIKNFQRCTTHTLIDLSVEEKRGHAARLAVLARRYGIQLYACCNDYLLSEDVNFLESPTPPFGKWGQGGFSDKILKGSCINKNYLVSAWGLKIAGYEGLSPTRKECACTRSIDIGAYDTCPHGCIYCYANTDKEKALSFYKTYNPEWNAVDGEVKNGAYISVKTHPSKKMVILRGKRVDERKEGYAEWQLVEE